MSHMPHETSRLKKCTVRIDQVPSRNVSTGDPSPALSSPVSMRLVFALVYFESLSLAEAPFLDTKVFLAELALPSIDLENRLVDHSSYAGHRSCRDQ